MEPDSIHHEYEGMKDTWAKCRDTSVGLRAVRSKGSTYLPRLGGQHSDKDKDYQSYLQRAQYFNAVDRTIDTMSGHIVRKQPNIKLPTALDNLKHDIDMAGTSLEGFIGQTVDEILEVGRYGILVEYPQREDSEQPLTIQQTSEFGLRPYLTSYKAEKIRNWKQGRVNNATVLTQVFLEESYENEDGEEIAQIRELYLDEIYGQRIWRQNKDQTEWILDQEFNPLKDGKPIMEIPFYFLGIKEMGPSVQDPPLEGLADTCLAFYRNSADYENALHVTGTPTPWVNGVLVGKLRMDQKFTAYRTWNYYSPEILQFYTWCRLDNNELQKFTQINKSWIQGL